MTFIGSSFGSYSAAVTAVVLCTGTSSRWSRVTVCPPAVDPAFGLTHDTTGAGFTVTVTVPELDRSPLLPEWALPESLSCPGEA